MTKRLFERLKDSLEEALQHAQGNPSNCKVYHMNTEETNYVLGIFHSDTHVMMIRKTKPKWQAGYLNFVGGKREPMPNGFLEDSYDAMVRECKEECGVTITRDQLVYLGELYRLNDPPQENDFSMDVFTCHSNDFNNARTTTEEEIVLIPKEDMLSEENARQCLSNVLWLWLFATDPDRKRMRVRYV